MIVGHRGLGKDRHARTRCDEIGNETNPFDLDRNAQFEKINAKVSALGLRLVKRTVNFDNHHVYHFYYGDERGTPGTIWTTFPYKDYGVKVGTKGAGQVTVTSFSVPSGSLPRWKVRLRERGIPVADIEPRFGEETIRLSRLCVAFAVSREK